MDDATEKVDPKINQTDDQDYSGKQELPEIVEPVKLNRHERRKREKLARLMARKEKLEAEARMRGK